MVKGQIFSIDFIIAASIFLGSVLLLGYAWYNMISEKRSDYVRDEMQTLTYEVSNILIRTPGVPENWNENNVEVFGLAEESNVLNRTKLEMFMNLNNNNYTFVRNKLGLGRYDFFVNITYVNGTGIYQGGLFNSPNTIMVAKRVCVLEGQKVFFKLMLWS